MITMHKDDYCWTCECPILLEYSVSLRVWKMLDLMWESHCLVCFANKLRSNNTEEDFQININKG